MTRSRIWTAGTAAVVVGIILIGWFLLISPKRSEATDLKAQATEAEAANAVVQNQIDQLEADQKKIPAQEAKIAEIETQLPPQPLQPALIRQLSNAADTANVNLSSITPSALAPLTGANGVQFIGTTIVVRGDFSHLKGFLDALEENKRSVLVNGLTVGRAQDDVKQLQMTVNARVFVATEAAPTTPTAPVAGGTAPATAATPPATTNSAPTN